MSSSNNCLIFLLPFTAKFLQLSIFISNSSTFFWNHTWRVFILIIPLDGLPWLLVMASTLLNALDKPQISSDLIDLALNTDHSCVWKQLFSRTTYLCIFSSYYTGCSLILFWILLIFLSSLSLISFNFMILNSTCRMMTQKFVSPTLTSPSTPDSYIQLSTQHLLWNPSKYRSRARAWQFSYWLLRVWFICLR